MFSIFVAILFAIRNYNNSVNSLLNIFGDHPIWLFWADTDISAIHGPIADTDNRYFQNY